VNLISHAEGVIPSCAEIVLFLLCEFPAKYFNYNNIFCWI